MSDIYAYSPIDFDRYDAPDPSEIHADFALALEEEEPLFPQPEPVEDPSRYATIDEFYDLGGLLNESCGPLIQDDLQPHVWFNPDVFGERPTYILETPATEALDAAFENSDIPGVLDPQLARNLRVRIRREAAA